MEINSWKVVCVIWALLLNVTGSAAQLNMCGHPPLNTKIVGGADATPGSWPWQVSVQSGGRHFCGGSLISQNWVLSAAHCFKRMSASQITILLGMQSLQETNPNMQKKTVSNIIIHEDYENTPNNNDIALVQLASPVNFTDYVLPVCLAASNSSIAGGTNVWVTGWGHIFSNVELPSPQTLQEVQVPIVSNSACAKVYSTLTDNMICAGLKEGGKDSCQGDSGGPLVFNNNGTWVQAGIVSFGAGCALPDAPGVYTKVSQYQDWINTRISSSQPGFVQSITSRGSSNLFYLSLSFSTISFFLSLSILY